MALSAGEKLGPYLILEKIGAGGMGEVYRARDERLGRDVALKVSAERFNERFEREAKLIASLNHHNICSLFDVGPNFLVMELIEGSTLAERIAEGPIPIDEALPIAAQIAEALQAAHDSGIIHRDLKPGNIKIRPDGTVKVLDFGLAKSGVTDTSSGTLANSPTMSAAATQAGVILGTAAYMSPEQARGKAVDKRSDIWAFGAVLYEMVTGQPLFRGEDVSHTLASVIMKEPDLNAVPQRVRQVLQRCLEKDPKKRLRDISGVGLLLEQPLPGATSTETAKPGTIWLWPAAALLAVIAAAALGIGWYRAGPVEPPLKPLIRLNVDLGSHVSFNSSSYSTSSILVSPDGQRLAYISQSRLYVQNLNQGMATELPESTGAYSAFFSPDGKWLAFLTGARLRKVNVEGGAVVDLGNVILSTSRGGAWGEDGTIIAGLGAGGALSRIPEGGGAPVPLTELASGEVTHRFPYIVPGGKALVYTAHNGLTGFDFATIKLRSLVDGKTKTLQQGGTSGRVIETPRGNYYFLYVSRNALYAAPFSIDRLEVTGAAVPVIDSVGIAPSGAAEMDISSNGTLIYRPAGGELLTVQWLDSSGKLEPLLTKPGVYGRPSISPDGERLALEVTGSTGSDIFVYEPRRDNLSKLTFEKTPSAGPIWSPDGSYIVYQDIGGSSWIRSNGGEAHKLVRSNGLQFPWSFGPDGKRLAYMEVGKAGYDLWTVALEGDAASGITAGKPEPLLITDTDERYPSFSPDGKWFAYGALEGGVFEIYVRSFPDTGAKWQISSGGGSYPMWSRTTHELLFENQDAQLMAAAWSVKGDSFVPEKPRVWSPKPLVNMVNSVRNVSLAPDGKRVAALMHADMPDLNGFQSHAFFVMNFFDELERRIPPRK